MMHHSPAMKIVSMVTWFVTALAAISTGLIALGNSMAKSWNIWESDFVMRNLPSLVLPAQYIIGICGLISLITWAMCLGHCAGDASHKDHEHHRR